MNLEEAYERVKPKLKPARFEHTKRVVETAVELAEAYGEDIEKTKIAAAFHDYAKYRDVEEMKRWIIKETALPKDLLLYHHELWHGPVGAYLVRVEHDVMDTDILSAITYHTTGHANMTLLEKIVFLADYIEPGRSFPGVDEVRKVAKEDLNQGCYLALRNTIQFLMSKGQTIYPDTFHAYNDFARLLNK